MTRRTGATLIEVLVAIFVMGIGMIALLTLFPLGAIRMAQAIQDELCARAVANANAIATMKDIRNDSSVRTPPWFANLLPPWPPNLDVFKDTKFPPNTSRPQVDPNGPSYPVFVDPIGCQSSLPGPSQWWVCGTGLKGRIARCPVSFGTSIKKIYKCFSLVDDLNFDNNEPTGGIVPPAGFTFQRDIRTSWAYLVQRPRSSDPSIATCSVVVYNKRPLSFNTSLALAESAYTKNVTFDLKRNIIRVNWGNSPPNVRQGDWILDCTLVPKGPNVTPHGYFYRIVGFTDVNATTSDLEVQQPIRGFPALPTSHPGQIMILEGVVDVYDRGLDRKVD